MGKKPHVLVIPYPAQGHVAPLMKLALRIASHRIRVTVLNTDTVHAKLMASLPDRILEEGQSLMIKLASVTAAGLEAPNGDRLQEKVEEINSSNPDDEKISCVVADMTCTWALEMARDMGIELVGASLGGPGATAFSYQVPHLIDSGVLDSEGKVVKGEPISLSSDIPPWRTSDLAWTSKDPSFSKQIFHTCSASSKWIHFPTMVLSNSFMELAPSALKLIPKALPIGPLLGSNHSGPFIGNLWPEDSACLSWLDAQATRSVIYVSFGSTTILSTQQLDELALGIELSGRPFLWVVRANSINGLLAEFPENFMSRVGDRAKIIEWAPQESVLAHPSVACFVSHCGWNSTLEGISMGVPFLCRPYFADQFHNRNYICDGWRIGLNLDEDENGIIRSHEICAKVSALLSSDAIKENVARLKEAARISVAEGGSSFNSFQSFIEMVKHQQLCKNTTPFIPPLLSHFLNKI